MTLFASGDSVTSAKLVPVTKMALRLNPHVRDTIPHHMILLDEVRRRADEFDILHFLVVGFEDAADAFEFFVGFRQVPTHFSDWFRAADAGDELRAVVTRAFNTDKAGQINRAEIFMLLRLDIDDPRWVKAMQAIRDAMRVIGSKVYVRCHRRDTFDAPWQPIPIDLAKA